MSQEQQTNAEGPDSGSEPGFDERLARLEEIVQSLEEGQLELEPSIERYREGVALLRSCRSILDGYKKQVEELTSEAESAVAPYPADPDVPRT